MAAGRQTAGRGTRDRGASAVGAATGASRQGGAFQVGQHGGVREGIGIRSRLLVFEGPLLHRAINLLEIGDAGVLLGRGARLHEVRDGDGREQTDDGHHDHDFHEREAAFA